MNTDGVPRSATTSAHQPMRLCRTLGRRGRILASPQPFQQGQLDGLCGIYAIINAIRLLARRQERKLTYDNWQSLFYTLIVAAENSMGAAEAAGWGIGKRTLHQLIRTAAKHMMAEHELKLVVNRVLERQERPSVEELLRRLAKEAEVPNSAVILSFSGHLDHWTVLRRVGPSSLKLFDSNRLSRIASAKCRMSYEPPLANREHVIHRRAVFRVSTG